MTPQILTALYYSFLLLLCITYFCKNYTSGDSKLLTFFLLSVVLLYIGGREVCAFYGDTVKYGSVYKQIELFPTEALMYYSDYGFSIFTKYMSYLHSERLYFVVIGLLYVMPVYYVLKNKFQDNYYIALLIFVCSFSFIGYGVNGLRNGLATTFLICAFFDKRIVIQVIWMVIAVSMHKSAALPAAVFLLTMYYKNPKMYIYLWFICIVVTIVAHGQFEDWMASNSFFNDENDMRVAGYFEGQFDGGETGGVTFSHTGFRYDFLLYSSVPIILGWYYIYRKYYEDELFTRLFCTYVGANAAWILTIYIPFNNRFAYLSWFLYPIVISYPILQKNELVSNQQKVVKYMVLVNYLFTFVMWLYA